MKVDSLEEGGALEHDGSEQPVYAGFWSRMGAALMDYLWLMPLKLIPLRLIYGEAYFQSTEFLLGPADFIFSYVMPFLMVVSLWCMFAATPGKKLLNMNIVDENTLQAVSKVRLALRYLSYFPSIALFGIGILWIGWDPKKQGLHDKIAGTVVIRTDESVSS